MRTIFKNIRRFISENRISIFWSLAMCCFMLSFFHLPATSSGRRAARVEQLLHKRENVLQKYVDRALETPADQWLRFEDFPDDMVLYRYVDGEIQSWANTFPISNDDISLNSSWYRIHDLRNRNIFNIPLAFLNERVQYVNLGHSWYIVKLFSHDNILIIGAIEVMEQYSSENSYLHNSVNRRLGLNSSYTTAPAYIDDIDVVYTSDGTPAFSLLRNGSLTDSNHRSSGMRWAAMALALMAVLSFHTRYRNLVSLYFTLGGIFIMQLCSFMMILDIPADSRLFSPMLYADGYFNSFGALMVFHIFLLLYCVATYSSRKIIIKNIWNSSPAVRNIKTAAIGMAITAIAAYIHITFRSLILNSSINFDLFQINNISVYTVITYLTYGLLFLAMLLLLNIFVPVASRHYRHRRKRHSKRLILGYVIAASVYITACVGLFSFQKECENIQVLTGRLAIERDLALEMQLQSIEKSIITDPLVRRLTGNPEYEGIILNRLAERYFFNILPEYDIRLAVCNSYQNIITEEYSRPVNCFGYYKDIINNYGVRLSEGSAFYYLDYFRNNISYLGAFSIIRGGMRYDLYLEIDSKTSTDNIGYPSALLDNLNSTAYTVRYPYSLAKYHDGRLTSHQGRYNFPVSINVYSYEEGFSHYFLEETVLFVNKLPGTNMIAVSRPARGIFPTLISFSYVLLSFGLLLIALPRLFRKRHRESLFRPKRSFRMKMTILLTASMVGALILMAIGSVVIIIGYINGNNNMMMEETMLSVQGTFNKMTRTTENYSKLNTAEIFSAMDAVSKSSQVDINLFAPDGHLIRSTRPEVFNDYLASSRMNSSAYSDLVYNKRMQVIQEENISSLTFYSLYTPIYNENGTLLAIANIPFFFNDSNFEYDATPIIAAIVNLYLILIIIALFVGITMSNSITRPLKEISRNMQAMDITHKAGHINYRADDELGLLVKTYNQMIDDLDRSTRELAQNEREKAWSEMARQIAHEIKNPLTPMKISIQHLALIKKQGNPEWKDRFDALASMLIEQIDILSNTASEFSSFAKLYQEEETEVDLVEILSEQKVLFDNRDNIEMNFRAFVDKAVVLARKEQITRTFVNLITNAIQAVEGKDKGIINITLNLFQGRCHIDIEDNGSGVSEENLGKLFSPNFTTKSKGSGLGLAICKSIVTQSHGDIYYTRSKELGGADFTVILPMYSEVPEDYT